MKRSPDLVSRRSVLLRWPRGWGYVFVYCIPRACKLRMMADANNSNMFRHTVRRAHATTSPRT
jgi:hypothetical protein